MPPAPISNPILAISGSFNALSKYKGTAGVYGISGYSSQSFQQPLKQPLYVGSSSDLFSRISYGHLSKLEAGKHPNVHLQADFTANNEQFAVFVLEALPGMKPNDVRKREMDYLSHFKPYWRCRRGYNVSWTPWDYPGRRRRKRHRRK
jgi:hypothetical protein